LSFDVTLGVGGGLLAVWGGDGGVVAVSLGFGLAAVVLVWAAGSRPGFLAGPGFLSTRSTMWRGAMKPAEHCEEDRVKQEGRGQRGFEPAGARITEQARVPVYSHGVSKG
jgi:hypothetical protein